MFLNLSHTPANRHECPCCKHLLTSATNTSILSLSLENLNFKFVTLTRAASQPVALFLCFCRILMIFYSNSLWFRNSGTSLSEVLTKTLQKICTQQCITRQHNSLIMMYACQAMMISHCIGFKLQQYIFNFQSLRQESKIRPMDS